MRKHLNAFKVWLVKKLIKDIAVLNGCTVNGFVDIESSLLDSKSSSYICDNNHIIYNGSDEPAVILNLPAKK